MAPKDQNDQKAGANITGLRATRPCPMCEKPSDRTFYPFCSKRCADLDLGKWLNGSYAIPVVENDASTFSEDDEEF
jgi:endogenous inhibitor of DNA gyrase (YacG/DUF329 family)